VFAAGFDVGVFDDSNGGTSPNGLRWTGDAAGALALETFLAGAPAPSGPLASDQINPTAPGSGGSLAIQTAALTLNLGFNAAGVFGGANTNLGDLVYLKMDIPDALSGLTLTQIIAVANQALAGNGLPAGYTFDSLSDIIQHINEAFENCTLSEWSSHRLYNPDL
jgi:hypothetical protein